MNRIKLLREEKNLTMAELATALNTYPKAIWRWENELNDISAINIKKLASFFDVSIDYLLCQDQETSIKSMSLTPVACQLLQAFYKLDEGDQHKVVGIVQALAVMS